MHYPGLSTDASYRSILGWPQWKVSIGVILFIDFINMSVTANYKFLYLNISFLSPLSRLKFLLKYE